MATLQPNKKNILDFNSGNKYEEYDGLQPDTINNVIESALYTQGIAINAPDTSRANLVGTPSVSIVENSDGSAKLVFSYLKGNQGDRGDKGATIRWTISQLSKLAENNITTTISLSNIANPINILVGDTIIDKYSKNNVYYLSLWEVSSVSATSVTVIGRGYVSVNVPNVIEEMSSTIYIDENIKYIKNVPAKSASISKILKIGGMTYKDGDTLKDAKVTAVKSEGANMEPVNLIIPLAVQNLNGYGLGISSKYYSYIDLEAKKFYPIVKMLTASDIEKIGLETTYSSDYDNVTYFYYPKSGLVDSGNSNTNILVSDFETHTLEQGQNWDSTSMIGKVTGGAVTNRYWFGFAKGTNLATAKAALKNSTILVAPRDATAIDISEYLTDDNLIMVERGGTLTFENEHGYDVPSEVEFTIQSYDIIGANQFVGNLIGNASNGIADIDVEYKSSVLSLVVTTYSGKKIKKNITSKMEEWLLDFLNRS